MEKYKEKNLHLIVEKLIKKLKNFKDYNTIHEELQVFVQSYFKTKLMIEFICNVFKRKASQL